MSIATESKPAIWADTLWEVPHQDMFGEGDYLVDHRLRGLMERVLAEYPEFEWLERFRIRIFWKRKGSLTGKHPLGTCQVASGLSGYLADCDYIVLLTANIARLSNFTERQMAALIYHELSHCEENFDKDDQPIAGIKHHDIEAFAGELRNFGAWRSDIESMREPFRQLELFGGES